MELEIKNVVFEGVRRSAKSREKGVKRAKINEKFLGGVKNKVNTIVEKLISIVER